MGQPYSWKEIYGFCSVLLCKVEGNFLYLEGRFHTEGFLRYVFRGLIFGGAYTWMDLFSEFYRMCKQT